MSPPTATPTLDAARTLGPEDAEGVVGIVRTMARELGDKFGELVKLLEPLPRIEAALSEVTKRVHAVEREVYLLAARVDGHDKQFTTIKVSRTPKRKTQKRKARR